LETPSLRTAEVISNSRAVADVLREHYDAFPAFHGSIPESHPARIAAIARLLGLPAALPDECRVLELGCATGLNLLPLAERFPRSEFTGVDLSPMQIAAAESLRDESGLRNVRLICADLREWEPEPGAFDYVIAHGIYSWVPDDVKDRLLAFCAQALAPQGVAYISYNVLPGWSHLAALRAVLLAELDGTNDPIADAKKLLDVLVRAFAKQPGNEAALLRSALGEMQAKTPEALLHDDLAPINDPVTFRQFAAHAARHDLRWFAEAHFASMPFDHLPLQAREPLAELQPEAIRSQQFLDLLGQRRFRNSLLTRFSTPTAAPPDSSVVKQCAIGFRMVPSDGRIVLPAGFPLRLRGSHDFAMAVDRPEQKAFFAALCEAAPGRITFSDACARAVSLLTQAGIAEPLDPDLIAHGILKLFTIDQLDLLLAGTGDWLATSATPAPSPLTRALARRRLPLINRWHETVAVSQIERQWLAGDTAIQDANALLRTGLLV
jgi:SAM-dependent methyltransferase